MTALLIIDAQNDFLPGGALAVAEGDQIIPELNRLIAHYPVTLATQDWHPANHGSFAANHPGKNVFDKISLNGLPQTLWPIHCVQNTPGAEFSDRLNTAKIHKIFPKGTNPKVDSYSGFFDNARLGDTGLAAWLYHWNIKKLAIAGLATDYCVKATVLDALTIGFQVEVHLPACRGVNLTPGDCDQAIHEMIAEGATIIY